MRPVLMPSSYAPHLGGVEQVSEMLAAGLKNAGHDPTVITNRWPKTLPARDLVRGVRVMRTSFRVPQRSVRGIGGWLLCAEWTRHKTIGDAREAGCDLVNLHCVSSNAAYALATSRALDVPLVVSVHGELSGDASDVYRNSPYLRRSWRRLLDRASVVTAPSEYSLAEAEQFYGRSFQSTRIIRNGVDIELFGGPRTIPRDPFVLAAGRLVRNKGFDLLINAWHRLPKEVGAYRLIIAGEGPSRAELEDLIARSPARNRIELAGRLSPAELSIHMRAASAFVLTSRAEALGLVVLEAMAAGAPVLATSVGGVVEIIHHGETGLLMPPDDMSALLDGLVDLLTNESTARKRSDAAQKTVAGLTWQACTDAHLAAYRDAGIGI